MATGKELDEILQHENWDDKVYNNMRNEKHDTVNTNDDFDNWTTQDINDCVALHIVHFHKKFHWIHVVSHLLRTLHPHSHWLKFEPCPHLIHMSSMWALSLWLDLLEQQPELNKKIMENLRHSAANGCEDTYDLSTERGDPLFAHEERFKHVSLVTARTSIEEETNHDRTVRPVVCSHPYPFCLKPFGFKVSLLNCVLPPFAAWRPRSRPLWSTSEVDHALHDGYGAASSGRGKNTGHPCRALYRHELERQGANIASHGAQGYAWKASRFAHGSSIETQGKPRAHDSNHVWDVQRARHVHGNPDCLVSVRFGTDDRHYDGFWWRCVADSVHLRRLRSASRHSSFWFGWPWSYIVYVEILTERGTLSLPPQRGRLFELS